MSEEKDIEQSKGTGKKPYVKPAFRHEHVFETTAAACMKMWAVGRHRGCQHAKKKS